MSAGSDAADPYDTCPHCGTRFPAGRLQACPFCLLTSPTPDADGDAVRTGPLDDPALIAGRYELLGRLGAGGMGAVYRARDRRSGSLVAVKLLPAGAATQPLSRERLRREARTLERLRHPRIVAFHDAGHDGAHLFLAMELVEGHWLSHEMPATPERALELALDLCDALSCAHAHGVVHRDLKPANVLLDANGRVKVADFGVAALLPWAGDDTRLTLERMAVGTPAYMSPEARAGAPPDPRMDVYSLGALLYELLTGRVPQGWAEPTGTVFDPVLERALAHDPARRQPSIQALRRELLGATGNLPLPPLPRAERWRRNCAALLLAVAILMLLDTLGALLGDDPAVKWTWTGTFGAAAALTGGWLHEWLLRRWRAFGVLTVEDAPLAWPAPKVLGLAALTTLASLASRWVGPPEVPSAHALDLLARLTALGAWAAFWVNVLEAERLGRSLRAEWLLWTAVVLLVARQIFVPLG